MVRNGGSYGYLLGGGAGERLRISLMDALLGHLGVMMGVLLEESLGMCMCK